MIDKIVRLINKLF